MTQCLRRDVSRELRAFEMDFFNYGVGGGGCDS
jgi:hypothetical protein